MYDPRGSGVDLDLDLHVSDNIWVDECPFVLLPEFFAADTVTVGYVPVAFGRERGRSR